MPGPNPALVFAAREISNLKSQITALRKGSSDRYATPSKFESMVFDAFHSSIRKLGQIREWRLDIEKFSDLERFLSNKGMLVQLNTVAFGYSFDDMMARVSEEGGCERSVSVRIDRGNPAGVSIEFSFRKAGEDGPFFYGLAYPLVEAGTLPQPK